MSDVKSIEITITSPVIPSEDETEKEEENESNVVTPDSSN